MTTSIFTANAKQVLRNGEHYADNASIPNWLDAEADRVGAARSTSRALRVAADNIRARLHGSEES